MDRQLLPLLLVLVATSILILGSHGIASWSQNQSPTILGKNGLVIQNVVNGLEEPSGFEFVGDQDILVTQKNDGKVKLVRNFDLKKYSVHDVNVFNHTLDSGISGITSAKVGNLTYVFLYYTENPVISSKISTRGSGNDHGVYRYVWDPVSLTLSDGTLVLDLPPTSDANGGGIVVGADDQLYIAIGDLSSEGGARNVPEENALNYWIYNNRSASGAVLRTTVGGESSDARPSEHPSIGNFYAIGLINPMDLAVDSVTGYLWGIEGASRSPSEIGLAKDETDPNLGVVQEKPGFLPRAMGNNSYDNRFNDSKFLSSNSSSLRALLFLNSASFSDEYANDLLIGDIQGNIYHFNLDNNRENIALQDRLSKHIIATGFGSISDLKVGLDGSLYVLASEDKTDPPSKADNGSLYRIGKDTIRLPLLSSKAITADYIGLVGILIATITLLAISQLPGRIASRVHNWLRPR